MEDFSRGCMRTYLILKDRAARWSADPEIRSLLQEIAQRSEGAPAFSKHFQEDGREVLSQQFDRAALAAKGLAYERLNQLTIEVLLGVR